MGFKSGTDNLTDLTVDVGTISVRTDAAHPAPAIRANGPIIDTLTLNIINTDGNHTITVAQLISAALARGTNGLLTAAHTDITPTAAQIVAAIPGCVVNQVFKFKLCNFDYDFEGNGAQNIILDLGSGVSNPAGDAAGTYTIAAGKARNFIFQVTNIGSSSEAITIIPDGSAFTLTS